MVAVNGGIDSACDNIQPGQSICLPVATGVGNCTAMYTVQAGDGCWTLLTQTFNSFISQKDFYAWNGDGNGAFCDNLSVGQNLCIGPVQPFCKSGQYYTVQSGDGCLSIGNANAGASSKLKDVR